MVEIAASPDRAIPSETRARHDTWSRDIESPGNLLVRFCFCNFGLDVLY